MAKLDANGLSTSTGASTPVLYSYQQSWQNASTASGTSISKSFGGSVGNQILDFYLTPTADLTTVSLSFQDTAGNTENIRYHNKIFYASINSYDTYNNATSINLTFGRSMGYTSSVTNANAEYGMYLKVSATPFSWWSGYRNFPRFHIEYFYIANNNDTYHGFVNGGVNAFGSTSLNRQLWTPTITTNNNVQVLVGHPLI